MSAQLRRYGTIVVVVTLVLALEALSLRAGTSGYAGLAVIGVLALAVAAVRADLTAFGAVAALLAAFTLSWNGVFVAGARPGDVLVFVAAACLLLTGRTTFCPLPWWITQLVVAIVAGVIVVTFHPPGLDYLTQRSSLGADGQPLDAIIDHLPSTNVFTGFKFIVGVALIPVAFAAAVRIDRRNLHRLVVAFVTGTALSGWCAGLDHFGTNLGSLLTGQSNAGASRQIGLSNQPNFLGASVAVATPFAVWLLLRGERRDRWIGLVSLVGLALGAYGSGSRGGNIGVLVALAVSVLIHPRTRLYAPNVLGSLVVIGGGFAVFAPRLTAAVLKATRLGNGASDSASDHVRALVGAQGVRDFHHSPLFGIGLQVSDQASQVYLQELASGGLVLFLAMSLYMLGGLLATARLVNRVPLAGAGAAALVTMLALNFVEADLTDRFYYVPGGIIVAIVDLHRRRAGTADELPAAPATV